MSNYAISLKRSSALLAALSFTAALLVLNFSVLFGAQAGALQLQSRSLTLSSTLPGNVVGDGDAGDPENGSEATHTFGFTLATAGNVGSVLFKYCTTAIGACTAPTGLNMAGTTLTSESLAGSYTIDNTSLQTADAECTGTDGLNNCIGITATPAAETATAETVVLANIVNPTAEGAFFVRVETSSDAAFVTDVDEGTVASSIVDGIVITSRVAETLGFSTKGLAPNATVDADNGEDCDPLVGTGAIQLGNPSNEYTLSITTAYDAWSAFRLYTNSALGTVVQYEGETLTKNADTIEAIGAVAEDSEVGSEQFGLGIDTTGNTGAMSGDYNASFGGAGQLDLISGYDNADGTITDAGDAEFAYQVGTPTTIATSATNEFYVACDTAIVRYMANISPLTPAGTYTTTVVYSAVPTY